MSGLLFTVLACRPQSREESRHVYGGTRGTINFRSAIASPASVKHLAPSIPASDRGDRTARLSPAERGASARVLSSSSPSLSPWVYRFALKALRSLERTFISRSPVFTANKHVARRCKCIQFRDTQHVKPRARIPETTDLSRFIR